MLTDTALQNRFSHLDLARLAIAGGADTIQFRQKHGSTRNMIEMAREIQKLCTTAGVVFIVNDRLDVALAAQADGVHLGQDDFPLPLARTILGPGKIIGGSASTLDEAEKCIGEGADYIGLGPIFPTTSKEDAGPAGGLNLIKSVVARTRIPVVAIGGVNQVNTGQVLAAGAFGLAVISAVCQQEDPQAATRSLVESIKMSGGIQGG